MDPRREYLSSRSHGASFPHPHPQPQHRPIPIPPSSVPSLSSGQGFYTVESLQGATVVPPAQLLPPPRLLPPDLFDRPRFPDDSFLPASRKLLPPPRHLPHPHPDAPRPLARGLPPIRRPPPPFLHDPRMPNFHPGRQPLPARVRDQPRGWAPPRNWVDRRMDHARPMQRPRVRKQVQKGKPVHPPKSPPPAAAVDQKSPSGKPNSGEGGPFWCFVCQIDCVRARTLKKHLTGKRHKGELEKLKGETEETKKLEGEDHVMNGIESADNADEATKEEVNEEVKEKGKSEQVEAAGVVKGVTPVAVKKRANLVQDGARATRKRRKSTSLPDAQDATVAEENEGAVDDGKEPAAEESKLTDAAKEELDKNGVNKEEGLTDELANGNAAQSAEVQ